MALMPLFPPLEPELEIDRTVEGPFKFRIGSRKKGYEYTEMPGGAVWKCNKPAAGHPVDDKQVLYMFVLKENPVEYMVVHGPQNLNTADDVQQALIMLQLNLVFVSIDRAALENGDHKWDTWNKEKHDWDHQKHFEFPTTIIQAIRPLAAIKDKPKNPCLMDFDTWSETAP